MASGLAVSVARCAPSAALAANPLPGMLLRIEPSGSNSLLASAWHARAGEVVAGATKFDFLWLQTDEPWEDRLPLITKQMHHFGQDAGAAFLLPQHELAFD